MQTDLTRLASSENFALLVFDGLQLLIPQTNVYSLEPIAEINSATAQSGSVGQVEQRGTVWSVYAFAGNLTQLTHRPESYRVAVLMKNVQPAYGLLCEQIYTVSGNHLSIHPIPAAMQTVNSPLLALAVMGEEVITISSATALTCLLPQDIIK